MLKHFLLVMILAVSPVVVFASDLDKLQGDWETSFQKDGKVYRVIKTIKGQTETVEVLDGERVMKRHSVDFEIDERDGISTFTYRNGQVTFGPGSPAKLPDGKYIYRIEGDKWIGIFGAFTTDQGPAYIQTFKRLAEKKSGPKN